MTGMHYVIGSGPAGIACAHGLLAEGKAVTILDTGLTLEPEREAIRVAMASRDKNNWTAAEKMAFAAVAPAGGAVPTKLTYGSDYPYRPSPAATPVRTLEPSLCGSYAQGGLSNVWGSAMLPYRAQDIPDWPITVQDLAPAYREVLKFLPIAARHDDLAAMLPLYTEAYAQLPQSRQAKRLTATLEANRKALEAKGVRFGGSRLAVDARPCILCGECLNGCPRELIYSTRHDLGKLRANGEVQYINGITVKSIEDNVDSVRISGIGQDGSGQSFEGTRVFLAAGVLHSTEIMLRSLGTYSQVVELKDSQYFLFPLLQKNPSPNVAHERLHTLAQIFIEIEDKDISPYGVHLQVYGYNDFLSATLDRKLGRLRKFIPAGMLLDRMMVVQGYLHSAHSGRISVSLERGAAGDELVVQPVPMPESHDKVRQVLRKMTRLAIKTQALPLSPLLQMTTPGRGFHCGGSFPMSHTPGPGATDRLGRVSGMGRTHLVDASVFPSIPATTITLTVMANAYRIGQAAAQL